jgi:Outer membrane protein beta-barrel domain
MTRARAIILGIGLMLSAPASTFASGIELRLGGFGPRGHSDLFDDVDELFAVGRRDFRGFTGGIEYSLGLNDHVEVGFHLDGYGRTVTSSYRDFEREDGSLIFQDLRMNIVPLGATLRFLPAGRRARISPYIAAGGDIFFYQYEEQGEFIDFFSEDLEIFPDAFVSQGATGGFHVAAGLRVPMNPDFSVTGEVRYQQARTRMNDDFSQNTLDLSGTSATLGVHLRF